MKKSKKTNRDVNVDPAGNVLVRLKDAILIELGIDTARLITLVDTFVIQQNGGVENSRTHTARTNTINELNRPEMTIKVFFNKFLPILRANGIEINMTIKTAMGDVVEVTEDITLRDEEGFVIDIQKPEDQVKGESDEDTKEKQ